MPRRIKAFCRCAGLAGCAVRAWRSLFIGGRDETSLLDGLAEQVEAVRGGSWPQCRRTWPSGERCASSARRCRGSAKALAGFLLSGGEGWRNSCRNRATSQLWTGKQSRGIWSLDSSRTDCGRLCRFCLAGPVQIRPLYGGNHGGQVENDLRSHDQWRSRYTHGADRGRPQPEVTLQLRAGFCRCCLARYHYRAARGGVSVLVGGAVFKTVVAEDLGQGGSIPLRLRYLQVCMS
jgi:hypothetical protein